MNRVFKSSFVVSVFVLIATIVSCTKTCDEGYEGKRCDVPVREKFLGVWNATDNPGNKVYVNTITEGTGILDVVISKGFSDSIYISFVKATIAGDNINIARQKPDTSKIYVEGMGTISSDSKTITWNYNLINTYGTPEVATPYTGVWTK